MGWPGLEDTDIKEFVWHGHHFLKIKDEMDDFNTLLPDFLQSIGILTQDQVDNGPEVFIKDSGPDGPRSKIRYCVSDDYGTWDFDIYVLISGAIKNIDDELVFVAKDIKISGNEQMVRRATSGKLTIEKEHPK